MNNDKVRIDAEAAHQRRMLDAETDTHVDETLLGDYADGIASAADREIADSHLEDCETCREDLADLQLLRWQLRKPRRHRLTPFLIAAAAVAAIVFLILHFFVTPAPVRPIPREARRPTPSPRPVATTTSYGRAGWDELVRSAETTGSIAKPAELASVERPPESIRGEHSAHNALSPSGVIIESDRPSLTWPPQSATASYAVTILHNDTVVAQSGALTTSQWQPSKPLQRDRVYQWQVEVRDGKSMSLIPAPPDPPAMFRIISVNAASDLAAARRAFPSDHRLLGLLYARYGMVREAREELGRVSGTAERQISAAISHW